MRVSGQHDVVANVVLLEVVEGTVTVGLWELVIRRLFISAEAAYLVSIPSIVVKRVNVSVSDGLVDAGEDWLSLERFKSTQMEGPGPSSRLTGLRTDEAPCGSTLL